MTPPQYCENFSHISYVCWSNGNYLVRLLSLWHSVNGLPHQLAYIGQVSKTRLNLSHIPSCLTKQSVYSPIIVICCFALFIRDSLTYYHPLEFSVLSSLNEIKMNTIYLLLLLVWFHLLLLNSYSVILTFVLLFLLLCINQLGVVITA